MPATTDDPVDISVVIPAYHGAATIAACLASVLRATEGRRAEIIVVDSSGDLSARSSVSSFRT
jgi:GT2 family glycosyltransferase